MLCPVCRVALTPLLITGDTIVDYCKYCKGIWFDARELQAVRREDQVLQALLKTTTAQAPMLRCGHCSALNPRSARSCAVCAKELRMDCPACSKALQVVQIGALAADRCVSCRGVWLDGGELETLFRDFQRLTKSMAPAASPTGRSTATDITMDTLIWAPDLVFHAAYGVGQLAAHAPDALAAAAAATPELAGTAIEVTTNLAAGAMDAAASAGEGAADLVSSFFELLAGLFD